VTKERKKGLTTSNYFYIYMEHIATEQNNGAKETENNPGFLLTVYQNQGEKKP
jgi:hypothetical protein